MVPFVKPQISNVALLFLTILVYLATGEILVRGFYRDMFPCARTQTIAVYREF